MALLERESQLSTLTGLLRRIPEGGKMGLVTGEAGAGKTSLIRQFVAHAIHSERVLIGACDPMSTPRPLGPIVDVASSLGDLVAPLLRDPARRPEVFAAVLDNLVASGPTVLVIEDAHWADEATLDLLRFLGRRIERTRTLLLITYRDDEVSAHHPLRVVLGDLATTGRCHRVPIGALSEGAVRALAAGADVDPRELYQRTDGNPFFVTEALAAGTGTVPPTVRDAVLARAARLSPAARAALDATAVVGARCEPWLLDALVPDAIAAVDACLGAGLLVARDNQIQFRHQLAADAVLEAISPLRQVELHAQVLEALRRRVATVADYPRLAHHADACGDGEAVLRFAPEAGRRASALGAHREAAAQYARALRHASHLSRDDHADLLGAWVHEALATGHLHRSIDACDILIAYARGRHHALDEAKWLSVKAHALVSDGRNAEADTAIDEAIRLLEPVAVSPIHADVWRAKSALCMLHREYAQSLTWGQRALDLAERFKLPQVTAGALNAIGSSRLIGIDEVQGRIDLEHGLTIARGAGLDTQVAAILGNLGSGHGEIYRFTPAERYLVEGVAFTRDLDLDGYHWYQLAWLALTQMYQGRWNEAVELAHEVLRAPTADAISRIMALIALGRVRARRGDPEGWAALDEALALATPTNTLQRLAPARAARAEAAWLAGRPQQTRTEARAAFDMAVEYGHPWHIGELGYWRWKTGDLKDVPVGAAAPYALEMAGDWPGAARHWTALGCPYEAARSLADNGDEAALRDAFVVFDRFEARPAATGAAARLRALGSRCVPRGVRSSTRANPGQLTQREVEVVSLVAQGRTNTEIAAHLYLSPKTIERHVSSIIAKLDAKSRHDAARIAHERGVILQLEG